MFSELFGEESSVEESLAVKEYFCDNPNKATMFIQLNNKERELFVVKLLATLDIPDAM